MSEMDRRSFLQMSLAVVSLSPLASAEPKLTAVATARQGPDQTIFLSLVLENSGDKPVDVMLEDSPDKGLLNKVETAGQVLTLQEDPLGLRPSMSRAGPRRSWRPVPARGKWQAGPFQLQGKNLPAGCVLRLDLKIQTGQGIERISLENVVVQAM